MTSQVISVLNFQDFVSGDRAQQSKFIQTLGQSLEEIGFFALIHHPVDPGVIRAAYTSAAAFFSQSAAIKQQYEQLDLNGQRGFTRLGREHAKDYPAPDLKEFWHVGREGNDSAYLPNLWPKEVPAFRSALTQLYDQLEACAAVLLEACALYLGQPRPWLREMAIGGDTILRVIHYPPVAADIPQASLRAAPHEDINLITLLCEATEPGLELLQRDGQWLPVPAVPGQIIVDTGDMLQQLTNGLLKSTTHRVNNPEPAAYSSRFSMPFFVHPRREVDLTPIADCISRTGGQAKFPAMTAGEYLYQRLREIGLVD
ncbi:MAG: 2-oxoglutarate and iron-dependent oxygenase domain-containing protein [Cyanobacteria bacterium P01_H01_bin.119]